MISLPSKHYNFIHIFHRTDTHFSGMLATAIHDNPELRPADHLFVTQHEEVAEALRPLGDVYLFRDKSENAHQVVVDMVNTCGEWGDWIIMHSMTKSFYVMKFKRKMLPKIVWRTWGHDVYIGYNEGIKYFPKNFVKFLIKPFWKRRLEKFRAVGGANTVDKINLSWLNQEFVPMPYVAGVTAAQLDEIERTTQHPGTGFNVMIGHSGTSMDNHFSMLRSLERFKDEDIHAYVMFPYYGSGDLIELQKIKEYAARVWTGRGKVTFVENKVPYLDFLRFLMGMDAVILDGKASYALGNLSIALHFRKKIFLNRDGVIKKAFDADGLPHSCTDEIAGMSYEEFTSPTNYPAELNSSLESKGSEGCVRIWANLLNTLSPPENKGGTE